MDTSARNEFPQKVAVAPLEIGEVFQACPTGRRPQGKTQDTLERLCLSAGLGTPQGSPQEELEEVSGVREVWASLLILLPPRPGPGSSG
ncbi:hypothetical protein L3Q82_024025 [Scortum barcoo]|uniref:Uncharacterized protein n=1 Tax=Scortum barcoo TaxID=214431 RepID=A0ACB8WUV4_9TELE|nr:hypothetical protein L3Q82_024025 [Scortum barcoo]